MDNILIVLGIMLFCAVLFSPMYFISEWRKKRKKIEEPEPEVFTSGKDVITFVGLFVVMISVLTFLIHVSSARVIMIALVLMVLALIMGSLWIRIKG